jgi:choline dehydrogenase-like flavoprotein
MRTSTGRWLLYPAHIIIIMFPNINSAPRRLFTARKEVILSAGFVGSPFILMHSGIGDAKDPSRVGIKTSRRPSVGRNLSDHPLTPNLWPIYSTDTIETIVRDPVIAARVLGEWRKGRTGPLIDIVFNQPRWSRVKDSGQMFRKYGDPSAGPITPYFELAIQVRLIGLCTYTC